MSAYDERANDYDRGRVGYAHDIYNYLTSLGVSSGTSVLDIGCGTGLASLPLIRNGYTVTGVDPSEKMLAIARRQAPDATWVLGDAEKLPFPDKSFGAAVSGQAFHHVDRTAALNEIIRVVKPGGGVAIWWKHLMGDDGVKMLRDQVISEFGVQQPPSGLPGGFREFYASALHGQTLRVVPWRSTMSLDQYLAYERSRKALHEVLGGDVEQYVKRLETRLRQTFGEGNPSIPLAYLHYLYLAKV
jgi:ubiquinone/menaquinone biosynthesis C-methylase UbiE